MQRAFRVLWSNAATTSGNTYRYRDISPFGPAFVQFYGFTLKTRTVFTRKLVSSTCKFRLWLAYAIAHGNLRPRTQRGQPAVFKPPRTHTLTYRLGWPCTWRASGLFCQAPGTIWPSSRAGFSFSKHTPQAQRVKTHI